jgi:hypothetical protein
MILELLLVTLLSATAVLYYKNRHHLTIEDFFNAININIYTMQTIKGINFDRYVLKLSTELSFLQFKNLEEDINIFLRRRCLVYKQGSNYIIDITNAVPRLKAQNLVSQTDCYNSYDFTGRRLLINCHKNILLINVNTEFFSNSILKKTTNSALVINKSLEYIKQIIHTRKFSYHKNPSMATLFFLLQAKDITSELNFVIKYGKSVKIFLIVVGNQQIIDEYGKKFDAIFATSVLGTPVKLHNITPYTPINQLIDQTDVILLNQHMFERIYIPKEALHA